VIEPANMIQDNDQLRYIRFVHKAPSELAVCTREGRWKWYDVVLRSSEQKVYLIPRSVGEPEEVAVYCYEGELVAVYWADPLVLPSERVTVLPGGPCIRLPVLPTSLQGAGFGAFCARVGYAAGMIYCAACQDVLPISGMIEKDEQSPCEHVHWCANCRVWSAPHYPGRDEEVGACPHRSPDDQYYVSPGEMGEVEP
jgi:hypothetical protein